MKKANVYMMGKYAGQLTEEVQGKSYYFVYDKEYNGEPISLTIPLSNKEFRFDAFPPFFDGLLPEGMQLEGLLKQRKIDKNDNFSQLVAVGQDLVGAVTVEAIETDNE